MLIPLAEDVRVAAEQRLVRGEPAKHLAERECTVTVGEDRLGVLGVRGEHHRRPHRKVNQDAVAHSPQRGTWSPGTGEAAAVAGEVPDSDSRQGIQGAQGMLLRFAGSRFATGAGGHRLPPCSKSQADRSTSCPRMSCVVLGSVPLAGPAEQVCPARFTNANPRPRHWRCEPAHLPAGPSDDPRWPVARSWDRIGPYDWRRARARSKPRRARRRYWRLAEHRRGLGHRARRARAPPGDHRQARGGA